MAGNETSEPPPATALIAPVVIPAAARRAAAATSTGAGVCPNIRPRRRAGPLRRARRADVLGGGALLPQRSRLGARRRAGRLRRRRGPRLPDRKGRPAAPRARRQGDR